MQSPDPQQKGKISGGNQPLYANYGNFNLSHTMLIQRGAQRRSPLQITPPTSHEFCKSPLPPPMSSPLDQDRVTQIEVSIVCMKRSVSTRYVPQQKFLTFLFIKSINYVHDKKLNLVWFSLFPRQNCLSNVHIDGFITKINWLRKKYCIVNIL
jgi:hypothetical protein